MNKARKEEVPLLNIERNPLILLISALLTALLVYLTYQSIFKQEMVEVNKWSFFLFVPTIVISFQTLWYLLNPFAVIFEDKLEIKQSLLHNKFWHFVDIKIVGDMKDGTLKIVYNDNEVEKINLFGIKPSHKKLLREELNKQIGLNLVNRPA